MRVSEKLLAEAEAAGLYINRNSEYYVWIKRYPGAGAPQVLVWQDGSMSRGDIRLDLAKKMTLSEARKALGLEAV